MVNTSSIKELREKTGAGMLDCKKALEQSEGEIQAAIDWLREKGIAKAAKKASRVAAEGLCNVVTKGNEAVIYELNAETDFVSKNAQFLDLVEEIGNIIISSKANNAQEVLESVFEGKKVIDILSAATAKIGEKIDLRRVTRVIKTDTQHFGSYKHMGGRIAVLTVVEGADETVAKDISMHVAAINPKYISQKDISPEIVAKEKEILTAEALNEGKPQAIVDKMVIGRLNKYLKEICLLNQPFVKDPDMSVEKYVNSKKGSVISYLRLEVGEGIEKNACDFASEVMAQVKA